MALFRRKGAMSDEDKKEVNTSCQVSGHEPEYAYGYDQEGEVETQVICGKCGTKL